MTAKSNFIITKDNKPDPYDFVQLYDKENIIKMQAYCNESIIETAKGRYDVRIEKVKQDFKAVPDNPTIANLMKLCLQERFLCDIGLLVTGSHAKVDFLFGPKSGIFLEYFFTMVQISKKGAKSSPWALIQVNSVQVRGVKNEQNNKADFLSAIELLKPVCCKKRQKTPNQETGLGNRGPLEALNGTKLILND